MTQANSNNSVAIRFLASAKGVRIGFSLNARAVTLITVAIQLTLFVIHCFK